MVSYAGLIIMWMGFLLIVFSLFLSLVAGDKIGKYLRKNPIDDPDCWPKSGSGQPRKHLLEIRHHMFSHVWRADGMQRIFLAIIAGKRDRPVRCWVTAYTLFVPIALAGMALIVLGVFATPK